MREMKDSGVEWIGEIPKNWKICRLKDYAHICNGRDYSEVLAENGDYPVIGSGGQFAKACEPLYQKESVLLGRKGTIDKPLFVDYPFWTVDTMYYTEIKENVSAKYFYYLCTQIEFDFYQYGSAVPSMTQRDLYNVNFPYPTLDEQRRIANYLDRKCSQIDTIIARQQEVIEKLKTYKLSVITEAVTKGLNPNVPMKDSGIDFIGSIPETWRICRLRNIGTLQNGISKGGEFFGHGFPFVSYGDVYRNFSLPVQVAGLIDSSDEERRNYSVESGDIFFTRTSETIEEVGFSSVCEETILDATFAGFLIRVRPFTNDLVPKFAKYYFRSNHHRYYLVKQMNLVTRASLGQDLLKSMPVLVPPKEEQTNISAYLDKKCGAIESSIEYKQRVIERLTAYKKSLIYEVVTGKKEV